MTEELRASRALTLRKLAARRFAAGRDEHGCFLLLMALYFEAKGIQ